MVHKDRRAQNETLFRGLNEQIEHLDVGHADGVLSLVCECSTVECMKVITVPRDEYELVRAVPTAFLVAVGHEQLEIEQVLARHDRYTVVEKLGDAGAVAEQTDPRG